MVLWLCGEECLDGCFLEIEVVVMVLLDGCVIDGELFVWCDDDL